MKACSVWVRGLGWAGQASHEKGVGDEALGVGDTTGYKRENSLVVFWPRTRGDSLYDWFRHGLDDALLHEDAGLDVVLEGHLGLPLGSDGHS